MNEALFRWINDGARGPVLDALMPIASDKTLILIPGLALFIALQYYGNRRLRTALWALVLAFAFSDFGSGQILKALFQVERPYTVLDTVHLHRGDGWEVAHAADYEDSDPRYGFPSSHASNAAALVLVLALFYRRSLYWTIPWALLVGYSRIYTGNHWPGDVIGGFVYGAACGSAAWAITARIVERRFGTLASPPRVTPPVEQQFFAGVLVVWFIVNLALLHLSHLPLNSEEAYLWDCSRRLAPAYIAAPPLVPLLIEIFTAMGGNEPWALRSIVLFTTTATAILAYAATVRITKTPRTALAAGVLVLAFYFLTTDTFRIVTAPVATVLLATTAYAYLRGRTILTGLALGGAILADTNTLLIAVFLVFFAAIGMFPVTNAPSMKKVVPIAAVLASIPLLWAVAPPLAAQPWSPFDTAVPELSAWAVIAVVVSVWWANRPHARWVLVTFVVLLLLPLPLILIVRLAPDSDVYHPERNPYPGAVELGEAIDTIRDASDASLFVCADTAPLATVTAFNTPGRPRTLCIDLGDRPLAQYDLWNEWGDAMDRDGILVVAGDTAYAQQRLDAALATGAFDSGTIIQSLDTGRPYTICRLAAYNGRPMNKDE